ncbi:hypothetical protein TrCOL_g4873 [Triparma columacea]|uniref:Uncharacterized protein n=1 Tax=Triparma columacea TaxID=722753 RepID=A0A9W7LEB8_9STRA|nr:hypothetical protein TrCOL_g4873 [Triparma columacea]
MSPRRFGSTPIESLYLQLAKARAERDDAEMRRETAEAQNTAAMIEASKRNRELAVLQVQRATLAWRKESEERERRERERWERRMADKEDEIGRLRGEVERMEGERKEARREEEKARERAGRMTLNSIRMRKEIEGLRENLKVREEREMMGEEDEDAEEWFDALDEVAD